jgi:integrase
MPNGTLVIREHRRRAFYEAKWRDRGRRQVKRRLGLAWVERDAEGNWRKRRGRVRPGYLDERDAYVELRRVIDGHDAEQAAPRPEREPTFDDAAAGWLHRLEHVDGVKPSTPVDYRYMLAAADAEPKKRGRTRSGGRIMSEFGGQELRAISTAQVDRWLAALDADGVSRRNVNKHRQVVCSVLEHAAVRPDVYALAVNVARATSKRREGDPDVLDFYEPEEVIALARAAREVPVGGEQDAALYVVAAFSGLRLGELRALRWRDVDLPGSKLTVAGSISAGERTAPKSRRPRTVPLATTAASALARLAERDRFVGRDDLVFVGPLGEYLDPSALRRRYRRAQKAAELRPLRLHDLRHTFGSLAVRGGVDLATLKQWMGHSRISTTERYLHAKPRTDDADRLDRAFEGGLAELERTASAAG